MSGAFWGALVAVVGTVASVWLVAVDRTLAAAICGIVALLGLAWVLAILREDNKKAEVARCAEYKERMAIREARLLADYRKSLPTNAFNREQAIPPDEWRAVWLARNGYLDTHATS